MGIPAAPDKLRGHPLHAKNWDIVVTYNDILVAAIECKSQVGSFGSNFNNRTEEAIGNAVDLWRTYEAGLVGTIKPMARIRLRVRAR